MVRLLVTRPQPQAEETAARLNALDIEAVVEPLLIARTVHSKLPPAGGFAALALTSGQALRALEERGDLPLLTGLPVYAVGDRTADMARDRGFGEVHSASGDFGALVRLLAGAGLDGPILYPAARHMSGDLAGALAPHGIMVITNTVYEMEPVAALSHNLAEAALDGALIYSRRTAETFARLAAGWPEARRLGMLCISEAAAQPLLAAGFARASLADHPSEESMMALALSFARDQNPA
jgi:uroporphyrinogen-III synthase